MLQYFVMLKYLSRDIAAGLIISGTGIGIPAIIGATGESFGITGGGFRSFDWSRKRVGAGSQSELQFARSPFVL